MIPFKRLPYNTYTAPDADKRRIVASGERWGSRTQLSSVLYILSTEKCGVHREIYLTQLHGANQH